MNSLDELPESVRRLVRLRLALRLDPERPTDIPVGVWGGRGIVPLLEVPATDVEKRPKHVISIDCGWLERNGFGVRGWLSVYEVECLKYAVRNDSDCAFQMPPGDGLPLFGREEVALPGLEVLEAYLPGNEFNALTALPSVDAALRSAQAGCPLFRPDLVAVLGGWQVGWPDGPPELPQLAAVHERIDRAGGPGAVPPGESFRCEPYRLLLWTLRDSEPWVEVWGDGRSELHGVGRIT